MDSQTKIDQLSTDLGLVAGEELRKELHSRSSSFLYQRVAPNQLDAVLGEGWEKDKKNRNSVRVRRRKPVDLALEDEVWALFARMGFNEMGPGRHFKLPVSQDKNGSPPKQIDVFARDRETILIVECKASEEPIRRSLQKDLSETHGLQGLIARNINAKTTEKCRVGWVFATKNIRWSEPDLARAKEFNIKVLRDEDLAYFGKLVDHLGPAARFQLHGSLFGNQQIPGLNVRVPALRGKNGPYRFYQFGIEPAKLLRISYISHRAKHEDGDDISAYQRLLKKGRLKDIRQYIVDGGTFPTNIVVNLKTAGQLRFDKMKEQGDGEMTVGLLTLPDTYKSAWVIDGQHRLYAYLGTGREDKALVSVLAYENLPTEKEAELFIDINSKQVKVSRNLLIDLMAELHWNSDDPAAALRALVSRVASLLGREVASPLGNRVKWEGDPDPRSKPITQTGLYEAINKAELIGTVKKGALHAGRLYQTNNKATLARATTVLEQYLAIFATELPAHWKLGNAEGGYLCTNNGLTALLLLLRAICEHLDSASGEKLVDAAPDLFIARVTPYVAPVVAFFKGASPNTIASFRRMVGDSGQRRAAHAMMHEVQKKLPDFDATGLADYVKSLDSEGIQKARLLMPDIQLKVQGIILKGLKSKHGTGWWREGVPEAIRKEVATRREGSERDGPQEEFFELIDYKKIAEEDWALFGKPLTIGVPLGSSKRACLKWFDDLNGLRNRIAHPERGVVNAVEVSFLENVNASLETQSAEFHPGAD